MADGKRGGEDPAGLTGEGLRDPGATDGFDAVLRDLARVRRADPSSPRLPKLARGDRVGRFEIVGELGRGAFGTVFEALDTALGRHVALKMLRRGHEAGTGDTQHPAPLAELFRKEAETVAKLNHPNIITLHDFGEWRGVPFLVLERLEGRTLHEQLQRGPLEPAAAVRVLIEVARALVYAHAAGVIHRDLKPRNIFLVQSGPVKVLDFGIAQIYAAMNREEGAPPVASAASASAEQPRSGTPAYMAPEQKEGLAQDGRTDVFSAGVTLFECLAGELPFGDAANAAGLSERMSTIPADVRDIVLRALEREPARRYQSAADLLKALVATERGAEPIAIPLLQPYLYREPFSEADEDSFFGRASEVARLEQMLARRSLVAVGGPSGAGKTSLVLAGLLPRLRRYGWMPITLSISGDPLAALEDRLRDLGAGVAADLPPGALFDDPELVGRLLRRRALDLGRRVLLFVDGFERAFTDDVPGDRLRAFTEALASAAADAQGPVRVLVALRDGCLESIGRAPWFRAEIVQSLLSLAAPQGSDLREALEGPARLRGVELAPELVEQVLAALCAEAVPLPTLQLVGSRLWERQQPGVSGRIELAALDALDALGGVAGVLSAHATDVITRLGSSDTELARQMLCASVGADGGHRAMYREELISGTASPADAARVLTYLIAERLFYASKGERGERVELAHASLSSGWEQLTGWLDNDVERRRHHGRLAQATALWRSAGRPADLLWRGKRLAAERKHREPEVSPSAPEELEFLAACDDAERRRRVRRAAASALLALLLIAVALVAAELFQAHDSGVREKTHAQREARLQRTHAILQAAAAASDPRLAALLLAEVEEDPEPANGVALALPITEKMIPRSVLRGHKGPVTAIASSPDGQRLVTSSKDGTARVWRTDGRGDPIVLQGHRGEVLCAAFSPDGLRVATGSEDRTVRIWTLDGRAPLVLVGHEEWVRGIEFAPDGATLLTASDDRSARLWKTRGGALVRILGGHSGPVLRARFGAAGLIATASSDGTARLWRPGAPAVVFSGVGAAGALAFSPRGERLAAGFADGRIVLWRTSPPHEAEVLSGHAAAITDLAFSPDGASLASASADATARIWTLARGSERGSPLVLFGHERTVRSVAFRADGARVVTASDDGTARLWRTGSTRGSQVLRGHGGPLSNAIFAAAEPSQAGFVVTASADKTVRVWSASGPGNPRVFAEAPPGAPRGGLSFRTSIWNARFSPDGKLVVTAEGSGIARVCRADGSGSPIVLRGHTDEVTDAAFCPAGTRIVTASRDGTARIWHADGSGSAIVLRGHTRKLFTASFSPDGARIVTASRDGTARVWKSDGSGNPMVLRGHGGPVWDAAFSPDGARIVTASTDGTARVWRRGAASEPIVLRGHEAGLRSAVFSKDGRRVLTASEDGTARVWPADGSTAPVVLRGQGVLWRADFSADGSRVLAPSEDGSVRVWPTDGRGPPVVLRETEGMVLSAAFDPRSGRIASASSDGAARLWASDGSGTPLALRGHKGWILAIRFSPPGDHIVTASHDGSVRIWPADGRTQGRVLVADRQALDAVPGVLETSFSPDGTRIVTTSPRGMVRLWLTEDRGLPIVLGGHEGPVGNHDFSPDGRLLATSSMDHTARIWSIDHAPVSAQILRGHAHRVTSVDFAPCGDRVVTASIDRTARIWRVNGGGAPIVLAGHMAPVLEARFSPDGKHVATASMDGTARVWDASGILPPRVLQGHGGHVTSVSFAPDGRSLLTGGSDRTARLWRLDRKGSSKVLRGHSNGLVRALFSPGGNRVLTVSFDGTARLWPAVGGPLVLRGHERLLWGAAFSADGRFVVTASEDATARVWRADRGGKPLVLASGNAPATHATFDSPGRRVAVAYGDGSARVWRIAWPSLLSHVRSRTNDCLMPIERVRALGVTSEEARASYEACERGHGRTPREVF